jgi:hypothetical protein
MAEILYVSIDYGASCIKAFFGLSSSGYQILTMPPQSIELDKSLLPAPTEDSNYENRAWVGLNERYYAVGNLAKTYSAISARRPLKCDSVLEKTCAVVSIAAQMLKLGNKFKLVLNYVLPPGELGDRANRDLLVAEFKNALKDFDSPSGRMRVNLIACIGYPEGMGLLLFHRKHFPESVSKEIAVFMLGFRNSSVFYSRKGVIDGYETTDLGFSFHLKHIVSNSPGYKIDELIEPVYRYQRQSSNEILFKAILKKRPEQQDLELASLKEVIKVSKDYYWNMIKTWVYECLDSDVDRVIICGGTADYLKPELVEYLQPKFPPTTNGRSELYFHSSIDLPSKVQEKKMGYRLADIFCLWLEHFPK